MTTPMNAKPVRLTLPSLVIFVVIVCLAAVQLNEGNVSIPLATAATVLVFCTRVPEITTWEHLKRLYEMRVSQANWKGPVYD